MVHIHAYDSRETTSRAAGTPYPRGFPSDPLTFPIGPSAYLDPDMLAIFNQELPGINLHHSYVQYTLALSWHSFSVVG